MDRNEANFFLVPNEKLSDVQKSAILRLGVAYQDIVAELTSLCPDNKSRDRALQMVVDSKMIAVQAITHHIDPKVSNTEQTNGGKNGNHDKNNKRN